MLQDPKFVGRFIPRKPDAVREREKEAPNQSPMRKAAVVRFNFTSKLNKRSAGGSSSSGTSLHKLMALLGIHWEVEEEESEESVPKQQVVPAKSVTPEAPAAPDISGSCSTAVQTEPVKCQICQIRHARKHSEGQTQTSSTTTCHVSTQVSIEDLAISTPAPKSMAHLTPAQLLAQLDNHRRGDSSVPTHRWGGHPSPVYEQGRRADFHDSMPSPNLAIWNNPAMARPSDPRMFNSHLNKFFNQGRMN